MLGTSNFSISHVVFEGHSSSLSGWVLTFSHKGIKGPFLRVVSLRLGNCVLTHYHTIPHFEALKIYSCGKHCEKRRNCLLQVISPFLTMFSTIYGSYFPF